MEQEVPPVNISAEDNVAALTDREEELKRQLLEARSQLKEQNEDAKNFVLEQKASMASTMAMLESLANDASNLRVKLDYSEQQCAEAKNEAEQATVRCHSLEAELLFLKTAASDAENETASRLAVSEEILIKCQLELHTVRNEISVRETSPQHPENATSFLDSTAEKIGLKASVPSLIDATETDIAGSAERYSPDANAEAGAATERERHLESSVQEHQSHLDAAAEGNRNDTNLNQTLREIQDRPVVAHQPAETSSRASMRETALQEELTKSQAMVKQLKTQLSTMEVENAATSTQTRASTSTATTIEHGLRINQDMAKKVEVGQLEAIDLPRATQMHNSPLTPAPESKLAAIENLPPSEDEILSKPNCGLNAQLNSLLADVAEKEIDFRNLQLALSESSFREENLLSKFVLLGDTLMERDEHIDELYRETELWRNKASADIATLQTALEAAANSKARTEDELKATARLLSSTTLEARTLSDKLAALEEKREAASEKSDRASKRAFDTVQSLSRELEASRSKVIELENALESERQAHAFTVDSLQEDLRLLKDANEAALAKAAAALQDKGTAFKDLEKKYADAVAAQAVMTKDIETKDAALSNKIAEAKQERDLWSAAFQEKCEEASRREIELQEREETAIAACTEAGKVAALSVEKMTAMEKKAGELQELTVALRRENAEAAERGAKAFAAVAADADELAEELDTVRRQRDVARAEALQMHRLAACDLELDRGLATFEVEAFRAGEYLFMRGNPPSKEVDSKISSHLQTDGLFENSSFYLRDPAHQGLASL